MPRRNSAGASESKVNFWENFSEIRTNSKKAQYDPHYSKKAKKDPPIKRLIKNATPQLGWRFQVKS